ncbi:hypothetical protein ACFLU0_00930 [Chloroflexota bacterium]
MRYKWEDLGGMIAIGKKESQVGGFNSQDDHYGFGLLLCCYLYFWQGITADSTYQRLAGSLDLSITYAVFWLLPSSPEQYCPGLQLAATTFWLHY